jgi:hypothetical protein
MANNYLEFSEALVIETKEERDWGHLSLPSNAEEVPEEEEKTSEVFQEYLRIAELYEFDDIYSAFDFQWDFEKMGGKEVLCMYAEEGGNVNNVATFVQQYLLKCHPDNCWALTWAETCSAPRLGEFGGGAVFVTAETIEWMSAYEWVQSMKKEFEGK